jgi:hypothetical protein
MALHTYLDATLDLVLDQMDQKLPTHKVPLNQPNLLQVMYALNELQLIDQGHLKQLYERDTKVVPFLLVS